MKRDNELPAWVVERCDDALNAALSDNRAGKRDLSSEEVTGEVLAELLAILEERAPGWRIYSPQSRRDDGVGYSNGIMTLAELLESPDA